MPSPSILVAFDTEVLSLATCRIARFGMGFLLNAMRVFNVINGILLGVSCYFAFQLISGSVTRFFLAVYIGCVRARTCPRAPRAMARPTGCWGFTFKMQ